MSTEQHIDPEAYERLVASEAMVLEATETICKLLDEAGTTRADLADLCGVPEKAVRKALAHEPAPTLRQLGAMAHALGYSLRLVPEKLKAQADPEGQEYVYRLVGGGVVWPLTEEEAKREAKTDHPRGRVERALLGDWELVG